MTMLQTTPSPIDQLPVELLSQIFLASRSSDFADEFLQPSRRTVPLLLCRVCSRWRETAISTHGLWSSLDISAKNLQPKLVRIWLRRAGPSLLSVAINLKPLPIQPSKFLSFIYDKMRVTEKNESEDFSNLTYEFLASFSPRWQKLRLTIHQGASSQLIDALPSDSYSNLTRLTLDWDPVTSLEYFSALNFESAPKLTHVKLLRLFGDPSVLRLPWAQLAKFQTRVGSSLSAASCLRVLKKLPQLRMGYFQIGTPVDVNAAVPFDTVTVLLLHTLHISLSEPPLGIFEQVHTPNLRSLNVEYVSPLPGPHLEFYAFLQTSASNLRSLILRKPCCPESFIIACMKLLPSLSDLILEEGQMAFIGDRLVSELTYTPDGVSDRTDIMCPQLESIELLKVTKCADDALEDMIESRWRLGQPKGYRTYSVINQPKPPVQLKRIRISFARQDTVQFKLKLEGWRLEGLTVH